MGTLPLSQVTVSLAALTVVVHRRRLAGHTDGVALPQVLHPARVGSVLHHALRCQRLHLELHTETVEHMPSSSDLKVSFVLILRKTYEKQSHCDVSTVPIHNYRIQSHNYELSHLQDIKLQLQEIKLNIKNCGSLSLWLKVMNYLLK